jgi:hypothetical protein
MKYLSFQVYCKEFNEFDEYLQLKVIPKFLGHLLYKLYIREYPGN